MVHLGTWCMQGHTGFERNAQACATLIKFLSESFIGAQQQSPQTLIQQTIFCRKAPCDNQKFSQPHIYEVADSMPDLQTARARSCECVLGEPLMAPLMILIWRGLPVHIIPVHTVLENMLPQGRSFRAGSPHHPLVFISMMAASRTLLDTELFGTCFCPST